MLCAAYARHCGVPAPIEGFGYDLSLRLGRWPAWARWGAATAAGAVRWLAPLFLLGRPCRFETLEPESAELLLQRLQCLRLPPLRGLFLLIKPLLLGACYGRETPP